MTNLLKLVLSHGSFAVLAVGSSVTTCYTDYTGTSRSTECSQEDLVKFAEAVLATYRPPTP